MEAPGNRGLYDFGSPGRDHGGSRPANGQFHWRGGWGSHVVRTRRLDLKLPAV